ncbi:MAG TPA: EamA family transporter [Opitutaceae bacterium]|nr:EamA family transporter [Opitutaceae bacterium]
MLAALLTTGFFAATAVFARRAASLLGAVPANCLRLLLATVLLGAWSYFFGHGFGGGSGWFFASGLCGFGLGGLLMFQALPRAGANLATLVVQCGSAVVALLLEWTWLDAVPTGPRLACIAVILAGVVIGVAPQNFPRFGRGELLLGVLLAGLSAVGQGAGQVLSRKAFAVLRATGADADPGTVTFERVLAGLLVAMVALAYARSVGSHRGATREPVRPRDFPPATALRAAMPWVVGNALTGPVLGVTCLQWALSQPQLHAGVTQSIVALAPLLTAPLALGFGEELPRGRYFAGALLAVGGTAALFRPWAGL